MYFLLIFRRLKQWAIKTLPSAVTSWMLNDRLTLWSRDLTRANLTVLQSAAQKR